MIAIVGAGILGRTLAWQLSKDDFDIALFDKENMEHPMNCSSMAAGMISPFAESMGPFPSLANFGLKAIQFWREMIGSFDQHVFYSQMGSLCLALPEHKNDLLHFQNLLLQKENYHHCSTVKTRELEVEIDSLYHSAVYIPDEAQVCAKSLLSQLLAELKKKAAKLYPNQCILKMKKNKLVTENQEVSCRWILDCRGMGAHQDLPTLRGVRGETVTVDAPNVFIKHVLRIFNPRQHVYIIPRPNNHYLIGASCIDSSDMSPISVRTILELLSIAYSVHKGFFEARMVTTGVHCRPAFEDNLPKIIVDQENQVIRINGLYRYGFLFTPILVRAVQVFLTTNQWPEEVAYFVCQANRGGR